MFLSVGRNSCHLLWHEKMSQVWIFEKLRLKAACVGMATSKKQWFEPKYSIIVIAVNNKRPYCGWLGTCSPMIDHYACFSTSLNSFLYDVAHIGSHFKKIFNGYV